MLLNIMLAYVMLFDALFNAVCLYIAFFPLTFANVFVLCLGLLTQFV